MGVIAALLARCEGVLLSMSVSLSTNWPTVSFVWPLRACVHVCVCVCVCARMFVFCCLATKFLISKYCGCVCAHVCDSLSEPNASAHTCPCTSVHVVGLMR